MDELAALLNREKQLLEVLVYRMEILRHMLAKGEERFLVWASAEVDHSAQILREAEEERDRHVGSLALQLGIPRSDLTLRTLAASAGAHAPLFERLRSEFLELTSELEGLVRSARGLATQGMAAVDRVLDQLGGGDRAPALYGPGVERRRARQGANFEAVL